MAEVLVLRHENAASFSFSFRQPLVIHLRHAARRPPGRLSRKRRQSALIYCLTPLLDMGVIQALTAQQRPPLACIGELAVLPDDRQLVRRGEGPPLRPVSPRTPRGGHQAILPHGRRHVCHGQCHVSRRSRLALLTTEVYFILMSHGSLTERPSPGRIADAATSPMRAQQAQHQSRPSRSDDARLKRATCDNDPH